MNKKILIDTSVWIEYFRGKNSNLVKQCNYLMEEGLLVLCAPVKAEILSGVTTENRFKRLKFLLDVFQCFDLPFDAWDKCAELRFKLARKGIQAELVDLLIAYTSLFNNLSLCTFDNDFRRIAKVIDIYFYDI